MRYITLAILLTSCASPSPTYEKGAYRPAPARAPAFSPTEDAPHTYRPGKPSEVEPGPRPPPVPHTPATRGEPTIWATQRPDEPTEWLLGVPPLEPERMDNEPEYVAAMESCANMMRLASVRARVDDLLEGLTGADRTCAAAKLYLACAEDLLRRAEQYSGTQLGHLESARKATATAHGYASRRCRAGARFPGDGAVGGTAAKYRDAMDLQDAKVRSKR